MVYEIIIDSGHGGHDPGAVKNGLLEKNINLTVSKYIQSYLNEYYSGHRTSLTRSSDVFLSLSQRSNIANNVKADVFISNHVNAGGGTGFESFIYTKPSSKSIQLQQLVNAEAVEIASKYGLGRHGNDKKRSNLAVVRETNMPAILTEIGFIDNPFDAKLLKDDNFLKHMAGAYGRGIAKFLNLPVKQVTKKVTAALPENKTKKVVEKVDNTPSTAHKKAVEWSIKNAISDGSRPKETASREQVMAMLYNLYNLLESEKPDPKAEPYASHKKAVDWAKEQGISDGSRPLLEATRQQVIQMLYSDNERKGSL